MNYSIYKYLMIPFSGYFIWFSLVGQTNTYLEAGFLCSYQYNIFLGGGGAGGGLLYSNKQSSPKDICFHLVEVNVNLHLYLW